MRGAAKHSDEFTGRGSDKQISREERQIDRCRPAFAPLRVNLVEGEEAVDGLAHESVCQLLLMARVCVQDKPIILTVLDSRVVRHCMLNEPVIFHGRTKAPPFSLGRTFSKAMLRS